MNQDLSAGLGAGLMNLGNMFSQMLMRRMDAKWEDEQYEKRLAAAQKAEMEKLKALDAYKATRQAGAVPFMPQSDQGPMQPMMQPVNEMGEAIGAPRGMQPHEQYKFEMGQGEARAAAQKAELDMLGKQADINKKRAETTAAEARADTSRAYAERARKPGIASPRGNAGNISKALEAQETKLMAMLSKLSPEDATKLKQQYDVERAAAMDDEDLANAIRMMLMDYTMKLPRKEANG